MLLLLLACCAIDSLFCKCGGISRKGFDFSLRLGKQEVGVEVEKEGERGKRERDVQAGTTSQTPLQATK